jgi:NAD(P)-dependent dehydrogenase (short-subunit alcohol dehydrogenase family)
MKTDLHQEKGTALITGASRGIGAIYADRLAKRGYDLILVARDEAALKALAGRLASETGRSVTPLRADLNTKADLAKVETTLRSDQAITMLVNNAGIGAITPLLNSEIEKMEEMVTLNITALTRLTYAAAPAFVARGAGTIINIASIVGISPETAQWGLRREQGVCHCAQPFPATRARGQRYSNPGGAAGCYRNRILGDRWQPLAEAAAVDRDAGGRDGRRRAGRARPRRAGFDS